MKTKYKEFKDFLKFIKIIKSFPYPLSDMFWNLVYEIDFTMGTYRILPEELPNFPDWVRTYFNANTPEEGREMALEDIVATYLSEGEV